MTYRAFQALTAEPWAIEPSWLPLLAAMALREQPSIKPDPTWAAHNIDIYAGPGAKKMEGARYATVTADGVALIPVFGPIFPRANMMTEVSGATTAQGVLADYRLALANPEVGATMVLMDTPGGAVTGIAALADAFWAGRRQKPLAVHVLGNMASAGFWVGSQGAPVTIDRTSVVGSLGVLAGLSKQVEADAEGKMAFDIVSSNAPDKSPDPSTEEGAGKIRAMLDAIESQFITDVARGRGSTPTKVKADFGQGGVLVGADAVAAGMADKVCSFEAAYREVAASVANARKLQRLKA
jgi:ClpP class serine protease